MSRSEHTAAGDPRRGPARALDLLRRARPWRRSSAAAPAGLVPAGELVAHARREAAKAVPPAPASAADRELLGRRERLTERFTVMQADLGGVFYEMAIRDHVRMDVLTRKAAELQRVDAELAAVERELRGEPGPAVGTCSACGARHAAGARFCASCGTPFAAPEAPALRDVTLPSEPDGAAA